MPELSPDQQGWVVLLALLALGFCVTTIVSRRRRQ